MRPSEWDDEEDFDDDEADEAEPPYMRVLNNLKSRVDANVKATGGGKAVVPIYATVVDPAIMGWPATLPLEVALKSHDIAHVLEAYGIDEERWLSLKNDPLFIADVNFYNEELKKDGMSFKLKARLQSEELLKTAWKMIHDAVTPAAVRADMLKFVVRVAGLDASKEAATTGPGSVMGLQINIDLGGR